MSNVIKIATWNVNSVRAREERLLRWLDKEQPDLVCLQELKVTDQDFPTAAVERLGYHAVVHGQPTYNGVATLSRAKPSDVQRGLQDGVPDPQARLISITVDGTTVVNVYVPNGKEVGSDKYAYKLEWMGRLHEYLNRTATPSGRLVVCGDMNVAPDDKDVAHPEWWGGSVLCHEAARDALQRLLAWGLTDVVRQHHPEGGIYSWWDYRMLAFPKGDGLRIDHILASRSLATRCVDARVDREERKGKKPSDHAPVIAVFDRGE